MARSWPLVTKAPLTWARADWLCRALLPDLNIKTFGA
jgi:hypothetical protein